MTTVQIAYEVSTAGVSRVAELLDHVAMYDVNWNGADFLVERGEHTSIDNDSAEACDLLNQINRAIDDNSSHHRKDKP